MQPWKQYSPKLVTELGMVMEAKLLQPSKQLSPKLVTELGIATEERLMQSWKQSSCKLVTVYTVPLAVIFSGITTLPVYNLLT